MLRASARLNTELDETMNPSPRYRIFVIGAGFSVHAGLPLGSQLFKAARDVVRHNHGSDNKLEQGIRSGGEISNKTPVTAMGLWFFKVITLQPRRGFAGSEGAPSAFQERLGATGSVRSLVKR